MNIIIATKHKSAYAKFRCGVAPIKIETCRYGLTLYDPGGGALKAPPLIFCSHAFNFGAVLLCVGDVSQKIV